MNTHRDSPPFVGRAAERWASGAAGSGSESVGCKASAAARCWAMYGVTSSDLQPDIERAYIALRVFGEQEHQLDATTPEDVVSVVLQGALPLGGIWGLRMHLIRDGLIEVQLRRKLKAPLGRGISANFEVDVDGSARIPTRIDRDELGGPTGVRHLIAAQELFPSGIKQAIDILHVRIHAQSVTLPHIDDGAVERGTGAPSDPRHMKPQAHRNALLHRAVRGLRPDVGAVELLVHEIGAFRLLGSHYAGRSRHRSRPRRALS